MSLPLQNVTNFGSFFSNKSVIKISRQIFVYIKLLTAATSDRVWLQNCSEDYNDDLREFHQI